VIKKERQANSKDFTIPRKKDEVNKGRLEQKKQELTGNYSGCEHRKCLSDTKSYNAPLRWSFWTGIEHRYLLVKVIIFNRNHKSAKYLWDNSVECLLWKNNWKLYVVTGLGSDVTSWVEWIIKLILAIQALQADDVNRKKNPESDHAVPGDKVEMRKQTLASKRHKNFSQNNNRCINCMRHIFNRETWNT